MNSIDWATAPEGAEFYAGEHFCKVCDGIVFYYSHSHGWDESPCRYDMCQTFKDYQTRPKEWPTEERISNIGQNGGDGLHYDEQRESHYAKSGAREQELAERLHENRLKPMRPRQEEPAPLWEYDRKIKGKHNTGTCTVDVYRVLSAFEITEPELQHCIKKLLAAGKRGAKDYQQDLREASASLCMLIDRLAEEEINLK